MEGNHYSTFAVMKKYEEEERTRLERINNSGHANPLYDLDIDDE